MPETLSFEAPDRMVRAAKMICERFNISLESFLNDALRSEIDRNAHDIFDELSYSVRKDLSKQVLEMID
jgi:hypothetical protein